MALLQRLPAAVAGIALAAAGLGVAPLTAGADSGMALCGFNGAGSVAPPVNYQEHAVTYHFTGSLTCGSSDSTLNSGTVSAVGAGTIGCFRGDHNAVLQVAWNNGKASTLKVHFTDVLAALVGSGTVSDGEFSGQPVSIQLVFYSPEALNCAQVGIGAASLSGGFQIGA
jgi:hypothetical protein